MNSAVDKISHAKRLIIKIGSALITDIEKGIIRKEWLHTLVSDIAALKDKEIIIVSSGAIALGRTPLGIDLTTSARNLKIEQKQAAASIGQIKLINAFLESFTDHNLELSQILLNPKDTENRRTHLNARATLQTLLSHNIIPVINENDTTATDEIRFGDNDKLAARVAQMMEADLLLILSTTDGLYTDNPDSDHNAQHIDTVNEITSDILDIAGEVTSGVSTGGMKSKIEAAQIAVNAGTDVIITSGKEHSPIKRLMKGEQKSTLFAANDTPHNARKRWIAAHIKPKGKLHLDEGAVKALKAGKSLLPIGVVKIEGQFERGDAVEIISHNTDIIGIGLVTYSINEALKIIGQHSSKLEDCLGYVGRDVLIHRNDMVLSGE